MALPSVGTKGGSPTLWLNMQVGANYSCALGAKCSHLLSAATIKNFMNTFWDNSYVVSAVKPFP